MSPRRVRVGAVAALLVGVVLVLGVPGARAAEPVPIEDQGWWSRLHQNPALAPVAAGPDASEGQLVVEATPEGATALSALRATLPEGATGPVLTLGAASEVGGADAVVLACQAGSGWTGVHAGEWSAKPSPDCASSVQGIRADDATWTFPLAPLQFGDQIDVVLVAAAGSAFRIVFEEPDADALTVTDSGASPSFSPPSLPAASPPPESSASPAPASSPAASPPIATSPTFRAPAPATDAALAAQPVQAALPTAEQGQTATAPVLTASTPAALPTPIDGSSGGRLLGMAVVAAGLGALLWSNQQPLPERRVLSRFGAGATAAPALAGAASGASTGPTSTPATVGTAMTPTDTDGGRVVHPMAAGTDPRIGGLGRFRRTRETPARRIS